MESVLTIDQDDQGHLDIRIIQENRPSLEVTEREIQTQIKNLIKLLEVNSENVDENVQKFRTTLEKNKRLINYQHCKNNKLRSLLHIAKYSKLQFNIKQRFVNTIVDVGYQNFAFSPSENSAENSHAFFFTAAKGDYDKLQKIVEYFKQHDLSKIHDTREGDTVLSFMIKFGDYKQENFLNCFSYLMKQNIDFRRIDYYKSDIQDMIETERKFLNRVGFQPGIETLEILADIVKGATVVEYHDEDKYKLFQYLITRDEKFEELLTESQKDSNDGENTLLQLAVIKNNLRISTVLLQHNADPNHIVRGRNEEVPLVLAAKLNREPIFKEILQNPRIKITEDTFIKIIIDSKPKFLNYLLESNNLNAYYRYNEKTPLYYAIVHKNKKAVQLLLQRGARLEENCLSNISPKDLEEYLNSCIRFDNFKEDMEVNDYKAFIVFDFFIEPPEVSSQQSCIDGKIIEANNVKDHLLEQPNTTRLDYASEISNILNIGSNKRLEYLLEHPLIHIFILLKWQCVLKYYYCFVILKFIYYTTIIGFIYNSYYNPYLLILVVVIQFAVVYFYFLEFKLDYRRYTLHFLIEIFIFLLLLGIYSLRCLTASLTDVKQVSAFVIIFTSLSILLTLGYHINLSKWMSMAKRVFKNFGILLLFFLFPILAFAIAFKLLLPYKTQTVQPPTLENEDFSTISGSIFRTFVFLSGDIGEKKFAFVGGYLLFLTFAIGMMIILLNFWTGVAVADIKEIEEQSVVVAFNNVIVFIDGVERIYNFFARNVFKKTFPYWKRLIHRKWPVPFLESKIKLDENRTSKYRYGIDLYINAARQFKNNKNCKKFWSIKLDNAIISKIKSLNDDKELNVSKTLKFLVDKVYKLEACLERIEHLLASKDKKSSKKVN